MERKEGPSAPAKSRSRSRLLGTLGLILAGVSLAGTLYFLAPSAMRASALFEIPAGTRRIPVHAAHGAAVAVALAAVIVLGRRFQADLEYYKPRQGTWSRGSTYVLIGLMALFGAYSLYRLGKGRWWEPVWTGEVIGAMVSLRPIVFPAALMFFGGTYGVYLFLNRPKFADFLIDVQGEMVKVSWPARKEFIGSSIVVIVVTFSVSAFLYFVDEALQFVMTRVGIGF